MCVGWGRWVRVGVFVCSCVLVRVRVGAVAAHSTHSLPSQGGFEEARVKGAATRAQPSRSKQGWEYPACRTCSL